SIIAPFFLGTALALYLFPRLAPPGVDFSGFALFMGAAMSVTAFPVLARILTERDLLKTRVGSIAIACAAVDDVTAWCLLAVVVVIVRTAGGHAAQSLPLILGGSALFFAFMLVAIRPLLRRLEDLHRRRGRLTQDVLTAVLLLALASAWITEWLGIHALFGAFLAGVVLPKGRRFVHDLTGKLEDVTVVLLLPLFFAFTGLRTRFDLVSGDLWTYCALVVVVAILGKFGGSTLAARATGMSWRGAGAVGALMNTRGLMQLVILSVGLDLGVLSPALFAMMVFMALVTTFMTSPILHLIYPTHLIAQDQIADETVAAPAPIPPAVRPAPEISRRTEARDEPPAPRPEKVPEPSLAWPAWTY
ncbi:MAG TPA: cation:proton antiporter, partial [Chloroflexota bacterium]|nr:cation:proton antiporter [Chloroflexota bacterium]